MKTLKRGALPVVIASALFGGAGLAHSAQDLAIAIAPVSNSCVGQVVTVQIDAAVTSTSGAPATISVSTDGLNFTGLGAVNWTTHGRTKTAEDTITVSIRAASTVPVTVCAAQPGSRNACSTVTLHYCDGSSGTDNL